MSEEDYDEEEEEEEESEVVQETPKPTATVTSLTREIHGLCYKADSVMGQMGSNGYPPYYYPYQPYSSFQPNPYQQPVQYPNRPYYYPPPPPYFDYRNTEEYRQYRAKIKEQEDEELQRKYEEYDEFQRYKEFKQSHLSNHRNRLRQDEIDADNESKRIIDNYYQRLERSQKEYRSLKNASDLYRSQGKNRIYPLNFQLIEFNEDDFQRFRQLQARRPNERFLRAEEGGNYRNYQQQKEVDKAMRLLLKRE